MDINKFKDKWLEFTTKKILGIIQTLRSEKDGPKNLAPLE